MQGTVVDSSDQQAIEFANIQLKQAGRLLDFQNSDEKGQFVFDLKAIGTYELLISYLGYASQRKTVEVKREGPTTVTIHLSSSAIDLDKVIVIEEKLLARATRDTISYNLDVVTDGTEQNLGNLINKLPGLEVDEQGKIKAHGKQVDHLLVNGKKFFGEQHQIATQNLSAEMVSKIDLINQFKDRENLSLQDTDQTALNIQLKEDYKGKITGDVQAFGGIENRWLGHSNLFLFKDQLSLSWITDVNNLGKEALTLQDYIALKGGVNAFQGSEQSSGASIVDEELPDFVLADNNTFLSKQSLFSAVNLSYAPSSRFRLSGYALYNQSEQSKQERATQQLLFSSNIPTLSKMENQQIDLGILDARFKANYHLNANSVLSYQINLENNQDAIERDIELSADVQNSIEEQYNNSGFRLDHGLTWSVQNKRLWRLGLYHQYQNKNDQFQLTSDQPLFFNRFDVTNLFQERAPQKQQFRLESGLDTKWKGGILSFALNSTFDDREVNNRLEHLFKEIGTVRGQHWQNTAKLGFQKTSGKWQYRLGLSGNWLWRKFGDLTQPDFFVAPNLYGKWNLSNTQFFSFQYEYGQEYVYVEQLQNFRSVRDFRSLMNPSQVDWRQALPQHHFDFQYFNFDLFGGRLIVLNLHYALDRNSVQKNVQTELLLDAFNYLNTPSQKHLTGVLFFSQKFQFIPLTGAVKASYAGLDYLSFINDAGSQIFAEQLSADINLSSYFKPSFINFKSGLILTRHQSRFKDLDFENNFTTWNPYLELRLSNANKSLVFLLNAAYVLDATNLGQSNQLLLSPELTWRLNSHFTISLLGENILFIDPQERVSSRATESLVDNVAYTPLAGYFGLRLKYNIRANNKKEE
ncbi:MAG: carboxypeptidase-like regulatory domain-containing protein [Bacteroidota bacterium]